MIPWITFEWETRRLPEGEPAVAPLVLRAAGKDDCDAVRKVVTSAIAMDSSWSDVTKRLGEKLEKQVGTAFDEEEPPCVVLVHGSRVIAASVLDLRPESPNHLLTGPCVLHEYRNRGLGTCLLQASLAALAKGGIKVAYGTTRSNSVSARFVYAKFGGKSSPLESDPLGGSGE
jgi:predicted GNAT family acetyltransferase